MNLKKIFGSLWLGMKGMNGSLRLYGPGGNAYDSYVEFQAPNSDFIPTVYTLPDTIGSGYLKSINGVLSWQAGGEEVDRFDLSVSSEIDNAIPPGYRLNTFMIFNMENHDITVNVGTVLHGEDIISAETIVPGGWIENPVGRYYSRVGYTSIFVESGDLTASGVIVTIEKKFIILP